MRYWSISVSLLFALLVPAAGLLAQPMAAGIRPVDHVATNTLTRAFERSPIIRALIAEISASNLVVHLQFSLDLPAGVGGITQFVTSSGGCRYVRISLSSRLRDGQRIAMLGHELQHALEIARSDAHDLPALRAFLESAGYHTHGNFFETQAAVAVEKAVHRELRRFALVGVKGLYMPSQ